MDDYAPFLFLLVVCAPGILIGLPMPWALRKLPIRLGRRESLWGALFLGYHLLAFLGLLLAYELVPAAFAYPDLSGLFFYLSLSLVPALFSILAEGVRWGYRLFRQ